MFKTPENIHSSLLLFVSLTFAQALQADSGAARVQTVIVPLEFSTVGSGSHEVILPEDVDLDGVSMVSIEPLVVETNAARWGLIDLSFRLKAGNEVLVLQDLNNFFFPGGLRSKVYQVPMRLATPQTVAVDSLEIVVVHDNPVPTRLTGQLPGGKLRIHFIHGPFTVDGPNLTRRYGSSPAVRVDGGGSSPWQDIVFDETDVVPTDYLRLLFFSSPMFYIQERSGDVGSVQLELVVDGGEILALAEPNFLLIDEALSQLLDGRNIIGWRWRLTRQGAGYSIFQPLGGTISFAYDLPKFQVVFRRGNCNDDGTVDLSDAVFTLGSLFLGQSQPPCDDACDSNDDGAVDISDAVATLGVLFLGQAPIPLPGMTDCGVDPTDDGLDCEETSCP